MDTNTIHTGDAFDVLPTLPDESVHAVVTDPPYGLAFMGRDWDNFEPREYQEWCEEWATEVKRVLKPGGHLLAFSGNRTHHRLFTGVEDAGFEIRDTVTWHYGSGFPKAADVSKTIDKRRDDEEEQRIVCRWLRERINDSEHTVDGIADHFGFHSRMVDHWAARDTDSQPTTPTWEQWLELKDLIGFGDGMDDLVNWLNERKGEPAESWDEREVIRTLEDHGDRTVDILQGSDGEYDVTAPATDAAKKWDGWKTGLKPATEFVVMARKPLSEGTVAENVQTHGTGALNIDGTRVEHEGDDLSGGGAESAAKRNEGYTRPWMQDEEHIEARKKHVEQRTQHAEENGRYPANVVFDETAADALDREVGELANSTQKTSKRGYESNVYGEKEDTNAGGADGYAGSGGPSRYFYTSKASRSERTEGGAIENDHPTVKPGDLMEWLIRLVTREGQVVLDPFAGSGTTCKAAKALRREFVGIERQDKYADIARVRCGLTPDEPANVRADDAQQGFEAFTDGGHD
jgi:DNA modification methylase